MQRSKCFLSLSPATLSQSPSCLLEDIIVLHGTFPRYSSRTVNYSLTLRYSSHHQSFKKKNCHHSTTSISLQNSHSGFFSLLFLSQYIYHRPPSRSGGAKTKRPRPSSTRLLLRNNGPFPPTDGQALTKKNESFIS